MDCRLQNVEQQLFKVDDLQEMILGFREEMQMMGCYIRQELGTLSQKMRDMVRGAPHRNGHPRNDDDGDERHQVRLSRMECPRYEEPITELVHIRQTESLEEFNMRFDTIAAKLDLSESYLVDAYVGALKEEIADSVRLFDPRTLLEARRMARVQEISLLWRSKKKMVLPIKNGLQEKFPEPPQPVAKHEGDFKTDQDSFIDIESSLTFNFKTQGLLADGGYASSFSSNTEVESAKISSGINGSSTFDFAEEFQALSYHGDRCEVRKQTSCESGSWLVIFRMIGLPNFLISSTVQPAAITISSCIGLQLATTFFKWQKYYGSPANSVRPYGHMGLEDGIGEENPTELQLGFTIPLGAINYGSFQKWVSFLNFSPTRILMLEWFKGELITMVFGRVCSLSRKKRKK